MPLVLIPVSDVGTSSLSTSLLYEKSLDFAVLEVILELSLKLIAIGVLVEALSFILTIGPFSLIEAASLVDHFTLASHFASHKRTFIDVTSLKELFTVAVWKVLHPLAFIALAVFIDHGTLAMLFVGL